MASEILKISLRAGTYLDYTVKDTNSDGISSEYTIKSGFPVHPDLLNAINEIKPFCPVLMGFEKELFESDHEALNNIFPFKLDFAKKGEIKITYSYHLLDIGDAAVINIPTVDFKLHENAFPEKVITGLKEKLHVVYAESLQYHNGKHGSGAQLSLPLGDGEEAKEGKKKSPRKSKKVKEPEEDNEI